MFREHKTKKGLQQILTERDRSPTSELLMRSASTLSSDDEGLSPLTDESPEMVRTIDPCLLKCCKVLSKNLNNVKVEISTETLYMPEQILHVNCTQ